MPKVEKASLNPVIPGLEDRQGNYRGSLILDEFPLGRGNMLRIAGYDLPFLIEFVRPIVPGDIRPRLVVDIRDLDIPISLLEGEEVELI